MSYIRREIAEKSAQTDHVRQNPQLSSGTVSRGGSKMSEYNRTCGVIVGQVLPEGAEPPKLIPYRELGLEDRLDHK